MIARSWAVALVLAVSAPVWAETAQQHVTAARAAEKRSNWRKALREWQSAYRMEINAEYLIGIGDAQSHLGNKTEARKQYEAYLADPLALPANAARVKSKIAALAGPSDKAMALALPAAGKGSEVALALPALPAPGAAKEAPPPPLPLPELDLPGAKPAAKKTDLALALPELPGAASAEAGKKQPPASSKPGQTVIAAAPPSGVKPAVAKPATAPPETQRAPIGAIAAESPRPSPSASSGGARRTAAWIAAGVAVAALGGGVFAYTQGASAQNDLRGSVHDAATAKSLLDSEKQNKMLSAIGFAGGLAAAGVSAFLFAF
jgi:hypothetical protein